MSVSEDQKAQILALLKEGLSSPEIAKKVGIGTMVVAGYRAALAREGAQQSGEVADALQTTFGLEHDLQSTLRQSIEQLEHGLKITDGGKEQKVNSGFIDITAQDHAGETVVIELKTGKADRETIGQMLGYMGDLKQNSKTPVRGIIVAGEFASAAISALGVLPNLQLKKYRVQFSFETVSREAGEPVSVGNSESKSFTITISQGALKQRLLKLSEGISKGLLTAGQVIEIKLPDGQQFTTKVMSDNRLQDRGHIANFYAKEDVKPGDSVLVSEVQPGLWSLKKATKCRNAGAMGE